MRIIKIGLDYNNKFSVKLRDDSEKHSEKATSSALNFNGRIEIPNKVFKVFPESLPYTIHRIKVSKIHQLHVAEYGNPKGAPAVFLHGGPGSGTDGTEASLFNPDFYRIILVDQRGAGKSTPYGALKGNNTENIVGDFEKIRKHLNINKWLLVGQSWGTTLALSYAESHPNKISGIILQGIFLGTSKQKKWIYQEGASKLFPEFWEKYIAPVPEKERNDIVKAYKKLLQSPDEIERKKAAGLWSSWEGSLLKRVPDPKYIEEFGDVAYALISNKFALKNYFLKPNQILKNSDKIKDIPTWIIQGQCDWDCPPENAWMLYKSLPNSKLMKVPEAGHSVSDPGMKDAYLQAIDEYEQMQKNPKLDFIS